MIRYRQVNALYNAILPARQKHHYIRIMMLCKQKPEEGEEGIRPQAPGIARIPDKKGCVFNSFENKNRETEASQVSKSKDVKESLVQSNECFFFFFFPVHLPD